MPQAKEQQHPQYWSDRRLVDELLAVEPPSGQLTERNLADAARLCIRYRGFPGATDIQTDLAKLLAKWQFTEESLFAKTRDIHARSKVFAAKNDGRDDWA